MTSNQRIGAGQFFLMIFLSRVVLTLTYSINSGGHTISNADWFAALFMPLILLIMGVPAFVFLHHSPRGDLCDFAFTLGTGVGKAVSLLYGLLFLLLTFTPVARFSFFVTSTTQTEKGEWFFPLLIMAAVSFGAAKGVQAIARTGAVLAVIGIAAIAAIVLALIPRMDMLNIYNPLAGGIREVGSSVLLLIANSLELSMLYMLAPHIRGSVKKAYLGYCVTAPLMLFLVLFTVMAVLGPYATLQLFPFYSVAGIAKIGELTNLSALEASVWIVGVFAKCALYLYFSYRCLSKVVSLPHRWMWFVLLGSLSAIAAAMSSDNVKKAQLNFSVVGSLWINAIFLIVLPLILTVAGAIKRRKQNATMDSMVG